MEPLDGNSIAGLMVEVFGAEMTTATGTCDRCGATAQMAEAVIYLEAPGTVARCRSCDSVMMVVVRRDAVSCIDLRGLARLDA
jgi:hypothetical protein